jgi:hypothetical protein
MFLFSGYDIAICCVSKRLPASLVVPDVPEFPVIPEKEAQNRPTLAIRFRVDDGPRDPRSG